MQWIRTSFLVAALVGCGATNVGAGAREQAPAPAQADADADAVAVADADADLPARCVPRVPVLTASVLSRDVALAIQHETSNAISSLTCECARAHGVYAPARIRLRVIAIPGRGAIEHASAAYESGARQPRDWRGFQSCVEREARASTIPVHVIGSDVVPDPDPSDERVILPVWIDLVREEPPVDGRRSLGHGDPG